MRSSAGRLVAGVLLACTGSAWGWNAHGHRTITLLALDGMPPDAPSFLGDADVRAMIAEQSAEPDRWRGVRDPVLNHENNPEHYLDVEDLGGFGLTLESLPRFRNEYLRAMIIAKHEHPEQAPAYDASKDRDFTLEWPGFAPHAIAEHHAKLVSSFNTYRILAGLNRPGHEGELELARRNIAHEMGILSHFVGDIAQPLHTTKHHHGWVGDNPEGFTTEYGFHAYIDGTILEHHGLSYDALRGAARPAIEIDAESWDDILAYVARSHAQVVPLYAMQRDGTLEQVEGKALIESRLLDGAAMLAGLYSSAWRASEPTEEQVKSYLKFN